MPRSRSRSILSRYCARISRSDTACVTSRIRSASVDLPWSMCATMQKFRMRDWSGMRRGSLAPRWVGGRGAPGRVRLAGKPVEGGDDGVAARGVETHLGQVHHHPAASRDVPVLPDEAAVLHDPNVVL